MLQGAAYRPLKPFAACTDPAAKAGHGGRRGTGLAACALATPEGHASCWCTCPTQAREHAVAEAHARLVGDAVLLTYPCGSSGPARLWHVVRAGYAYDIRNALAWGDLCLASV